MQWAYDTKKQLTHLWREYGSLNNVVTAVAIVIAAAWAWGSVMTMQRNYSLQKKYDEQQKQLQLTQLEVDTLQYQQNYYKTDEYKDYAARRDLGLASPGEKVLILPPNSAQVEAQVAADTAAANQAAPGSAASNLQQWIDFLSGKSADASLQN